MINAVIQDVGYILVHAPDILLWHGSSIRQARQFEPEASWLASIPHHLRSYLQAVQYPPNQCVIGNLTPDELNQMARPWFRVAYLNKHPATCGEVYDEALFYAVLCYTDTFNLTVWSARFVDSVRLRISENTLLAGKGCCHCRR